MFEDKSEASSCAAADCVAVSYTPPPFAENFSSDRNALVSRLIDTVRFPLMVLVVGIHVPLVQYVKDGDIAAFPVADFLYQMTAQGVSRIAVPLFFFISGFLFFFKADWGVAAYVSKIKKRVFTLVVPMLAWCGIAMLYTYLAWLGGWTYNIDFSGLDARRFFEFYLGVGDSKEPINLPFWFVRDLFVVGLFSPLWFFLLRKFKIWTVLILGLYWMIPKLFFGFHMPCMAPETIFFFCLGGFFSINGKDLVRVCSKVKIEAAIVYPAALLFTYFFGRSDMAPYVHKIGILAGMVLAIALVSGFLSRNPTFKMPKVFSDATFFVLGAHMFFVLLPRVVLRGRVLETNLSVGTVYFGSIVFSVCACVLVSVCVRKFAPWSLRVLTGGR